MLHVSLCEKCIDCSFFLNFFREFFHTYSPRIARASFVLLSFSSFPARRRIPTSRSAFHIVLLLSRRTPGIAGFRRALGAFLLHASRRLRFTSFARLSRALRSFSSSRSPFFCTATALGAFPASLRDSPLHAHRARFLQSPGDRNPKRPTSSDVHGRRTVLDLRASLFRTSVVREPRAFETNVSSRKKFADVFFPPDSRKSLPGTC